MTLTNRSATVSARGVVLIGYVGDNEMPKRAGPMDFTPSERKHTTITFDFPGTPEELLKAASFHAIDHDGNEWSWQPTAT